MTDVDVGGAIEFAAVTNCGSCRSEQRITASPLFPPNPDVTLGDHVYARSMAATLAGSTAVRHRQVLRSRRLQAISRLVERAEFEGHQRGRNRLHEIHQRTLQGQLSLAGN